MYDRSDQIDQLAAALAAAQSEMRPAALNAQNPHLRNRYADLGSVWDACREPLTKNGLSVIQPPAITENGAVRVTTVLMHSSGQYVECSMEAEPGSNKGVTAVQAAGSIVTYLRRYMLASLVGIYAGDDDDGSSQPTPPRPAQRPQPARPQPNGTASGGAPEPEWDDDPGPLADDELKIREGEARAFVATALQLLPYYKAKQHLTNAAKQLGYDGIPGNGPDRLTLYRALKAHAAEKATN